MKKSEEIRLLSDIEVAEILNLSASWVRKQRYLRKNNQEHTLTLDPVLLGGVPRYRSEDVFAWMSSL